MVPHITSHIHVLIIHHLPLMRAALMHLLASRPQLSVVGAVATCANALAVREQVNLIVFDPDLLGTPLAPDIHDALTKLAHVPVLVVTADTCGHASHQMVEAGVRGVVFKTQPVEVLDHAIATVASGDTWFDPGLAISLLTESNQSSEHIEQPENGAYSALTRQEWNIVRLVCEGLSNTDISQYLTLSDITVRYHLTRIYRKLNVENRLALVVYAFRNGLASSTASFHAPQRGVRSFFGDEQKIGKDVPLVCSTTRWYAARAVSFHCIDPTDIHGSYDVYSNAHKY